MGSGCHTSSSKTQFTMAGTAYPVNGQRDVNDCNGIDGTGVAFALFDDNGVEFIPRIQVDSVGNFFTNRALPPSYRVKIITRGQEAVMNTPVTNGDCNYCHAANDFMGAKGRVIPPMP